MSCLAAVSTIDEITIPFLDGPFKSGPFKEGSLLSCNLRELRDKGEKLQRTIQRADEFIRGCSGMLVSPKYEKFMAECLIQDLLQHKHEFCAVFNRVCAATDSIHDHFVQDNETLKHVGIRDPQAFFDLSGKVSQLSIKDFNCRNIFISLKRIKDRATALQS